MPPSDNSSERRIGRRFKRPWVRSKRAIPRKVVRPLERFLSEEAGSGGLLLAAAVLALVWSNIDSSSYEEWWTTTLSIDIGSLHFDEDLRHIVNDLLMAVFFYVVTLEVKREILFGSLRERATAVVPVAAALGTMVGGALVYVAVNIDGGVLQGWAVPIATDIAFALAVLGVAGRRAPPELRAFLLTLAVVDDLGTIAVIAVFFSDGISLAWLAGAVAVAFGVFVMQRIGIRYMAAYVIAAGLLWITVFESGVHATIAGVVLGFLTPAVAFHRREPAAEEIGNRLTEISESANEEISEATMWETSRLAGEAVSPLARMEGQLHPWSAFVILPLFALANAGVTLSPSELGDALTSQVGLGVILGLVIGAPIGGILLAWLVVRTTPTRLPDGLGWSHIAGVAPLKGIGFTVAIFISLLAFDSTLAQEQAKVAILIGSTLSALIGYATLRLAGRVFIAQGSD